jgi:hypothetical protein
MDQMPPADATMIEEEVIAADRIAALHAAFAELPRSCGDLLSMLAAVLRGDQCDHGRGDGRHRPDTCALPGPAACFPHLAAIADIQAKYTKHTLERGDRDG